MNELFVDQNLENNLTEEKKQTNTYFRLLSSLKKLE